MSAQDRDGGARGDGRGLLGPPRAAPGAAGAAAGGAVRGGGLRGGRGRPRPRPRVPGGWPIACGRRFSPLQVSCNRHFR